MRRIELIFAGLLALASCGSPPPSHRAADTGHPSTPAPRALANAPTDGRSAEAATAIVEGYFARLRANDVKGAYRLWGGGGEATGKTLAAFRADFAGLAGLQADVGAATDQEGAAGSIYITVPVHVTGRHAGGAPLDSRGTLTLRRVNDVSGSTEAQRRWHIQSSDVAF